MIAASARSFAASSPRPASSKAVAASRRFLPSVASTDVTSSSLSSRACLPETSAFVIEVSTIRRVDERSSSRAFIDAVSSARSLSLSSAMAPAYGAGQVGL